MKDAFSLTKVASGREVLAEQLVLLDLQASLLQMHVGAAWPALVTSCF